MRLDLDEMDDVTPRNPVEEEQTPRMVRPGMQDRLLVGAGNSLIALGQRLKNLSVINPDPDTGSSIWEDAT
jgi:hypothetical protein